MTIKKISPNQVLLSGFHSILARLSSDPSSVHQLFISENRKEKRSQRIFLKSKELGIKVEVVSNKELKVLFGNLKSQGVVALAEKKVLSETLGELIQNIAPNKRGILPTLVFLDGVTDPRNLGAIIRTADAVGVGGIIVPMNHSVSLNDIAKKISCGASDNIPFIKVPNLARAIELVQDLGYRVFGMEARKSSDLFLNNLQGSNVFIFGNEGFGLKTRTKEFCDKLVHIPMNGNVDSLNISVACGVTLFEEYRQKLEIVLPN